MSKAKKKFRFTFNFGGERTPDKAATPTGISYSGHIESTAAPDSLTDLQSLAVAYRDSTLTKYAVVPSSPNPIEESGMLDYHIYVSGNNRNYHIWFPAIDVTDAEDWAWNLLNQIHGDIYSYEAHQVG